MTFKTKLVVALLATAPAMIRAKGKKGAPKKGKKGGLDLKSVRSIAGEGAAQAGAVMARLVDSAYPDGIGTVTSTLDDPNPRTISNIVADFQEGFLADATSDMLWSWGQFIDHDLDLSEPSHEESEKRDIEVPACDSDILCTIPFTRTAHTLVDGKREHFNFITSFLDASMVYGSDLRRAIALRAPGGLLKVSDDGHNLLPFNTIHPNAAPEGSSPEAFFLAGDVRANEQIGLAAMHTLFVREHNRLVGKLVEAFPGSRDDELYEMARKIVGAEVQIVTYKEFLPKLLGPLFAPNIDHYQPEHYDPSVHSGIYTEFSTVAFRVGHTMLSSTFIGVGESGLSLAEAFFNPSLLTDAPENMDLLLAGFCLHPAQRVDTMVVDEVRNFLFGAPIAKVGHDLVSMNIERGRDHGIPKYNALRAGLELEPYTSFDQFDEHAREALRTAYNNDLSLVDAWMGGLAEKHVMGGLVGELFATIISRQFRDLMLSDPFFYKRDQDLNNDKLREEVIDLHEITLSDIIACNTGLTMNNIESAMSI